MSKANKPIRVFNKYVTNRILRVFAHSSRGPFAILGHVGRRSGKPYETTIMVWPLDEGFVIELTYGSSVDWYRNALAAGRATIYWHKKLYTVAKPEPMDPKQASLALPRLARGFLKLMNRHEYVYLKIIASESANA